MVRPNDSAAAQDDTWRRLSECAERFEDACRRTDNVRLEDFLPSVGDPLRADVLLELIKTDLEIRWRQGRGRPLEHYAGTYPELGPVSLLPAALIFEEFLVRRKHGDRPELATYRSRFPERFAELQRLTHDAPAQTIPAAVPTPSQPASPASMENVILPVGGGYKLEEKLGEGGFGVVWRATAPGGFPAAVKLVRREASSDERQREERSLEVIKRLSHHFLCRTQQAFSLPEQLVIIMDLADSNLRARLKEIRRAGGSGIPPAELLRYIRESAEAVDYLHGQGVLHRDIKPDNILLVQDRQLYHVRLADFGLARREENVAKTTLGAGTPPYMAPEVWRDKPEQGSDQYALAISYVELRLGRRPFQADNYYAYMMSHLEGEPDLEGMPDAEKTIIRKALSRRSADRYRSCEEFVQHLARVVSSGSQTMELPAQPEAPAVPLQPAPRPPVRQVDKTAVESPRSPPPRDDVTQVEIEGTLLPHRATERPAPRPAENKVAPPPETPPTATPADRSMPSTPTALKTPPLAELKLGKSSALKQPAPKRWKTLLLIALLGVVLLVGAAFLIGPALFGLSGTAEVLAPAPVTLQPGQKTEVTIEIQRKGFNGPVDLVFTVPKNVRMDEKATIPEGQTSVRVPVTLTAAFGNGVEVVGIEARAGKHSSTAELRITVGSGDGIYLPPYCQPDGDLVEVRGRKLYRAVKLERKRSGMPDVPPISFVLIYPKRAADNWPPFYLMRTRTSNAQYRAAIDPKWPKNDLPAVGMSASRAAEFAALLGGRLPDPDETDRALGYDPGNPDGPAHADQAIVKRRGEENGQPVSRQNPGDVTPDGVIDLCGNGWEFTRALLDSDGKVGVNNQPADARVILRGQSWTFSQPLTYGKLKQWRDDPKATITQNYGAEGAFTGVRVLLDVPSN